MKAMTDKEQAEHERVTAEVMRASLALRRAGQEDEDLQVALARIEEWLGQNEGRWVA